MKISATISSLVLLALTAANAQTVTLNCVFSFIFGNTYMCRLNGVTVVDNESQVINIGGVHLAGQSNANVRRVEIANSNIPFIVTQIFSTFPNLNTFLIMTDSGLNRIQPGAFSSATNLQFITITSNRNLRTIPASAFIGTPRVTFLDLFNNQIETVHEMAFNGLDFIQMLFLDFNRIRQLPVNVFRQLTDLNTLYLSNNSLTALHGNIVANNPNLEELRLLDNPINAIGRNFLINNQRLQSLNMLRNECADSFWIVGQNQVTVETIRQGLSTCFDNAVETPVKRFMLELRGTLALQNEDGSEIIRI